MTKCSNPDCKNRKAWGFRYTKDHTPWCDICWGHKFGEATCAMCERGCYDEEDWDVPTNTHICGACRTEEKKLDKMIDADIQFQKHNL